MADKKVTIMRLEVDLQCEKCYKKVKKVLCEFPQIQDQMYDEKNNIVTIKVVCCSPERIRDELCCRGCGAIRSIEIVEPPTPKPQKTKKLEEPPPPVCQSPPKDPGSPPPSACQPAPPRRVCCVSCYEGRPGGPCFHPQTIPVCQPPAPPRRVCCVSCYEGRPGGPCFDPQPVPVCPPPPACPPAPLRRVCCVSCYEGRPGGPCFDGYRGPPVYYYYGRPICDGYGGGKRYCVSRCDEYFCEDNTSGCTIM